MDTPNELLDLKVSVEMMRGELAGLRLSLTALAVRVLELAPGDPRTLALLKVAGVFAGATEGEMAGHIAGQVAKDAEIWGKDGVDPVLVLAVLANQHLIAGAQQQQALQTWIAQATSDELEQDIADTLARIGLAPTGGASENEKPAKRRRPGRPKTGDS